MKAILAIFAGLLELANGWLQHRQRAGDREHGALQRDKEVRDETDRAHADARDLSAAAGRMQSDLDGVFTRDD